MTAQSTLTLLAPAKLNLALAVGPPTPPKGYHPIASLFVAIDLHDDIELTRRHAGEPSTHTIQWAPDAPRPSPIDWPTSKDLGVRAHRLLEAHVARELPIHMVVRKRIPVGAGLGGGSSDAASVLNGLVQLFALDVSQKTLKSLATTLGSDIAFFLDGPECVPAIVTGFGEAIAPTSIKLADMQAVIIMPPFGCPTGPVYQAFDARPAATLDEPRVRAIVQHAVHTGTIDALALFNDLAAPACAVRPELGIILAQLRKALGPARPVHVTGSGSTLFVLSSEKDTHRVRQVVLATCPEVACVIAALRT